MQAALALAGHFGLLEPTPEQAAQGLSAQQNASQINGMLICVEMFVASLVHPLCFPPGDYAPEQPRAAVGPALAPALTPSPSAALFEALIPKDVASDVRKASWNLVNPEQLGLAGTGGLATPEGGLSREASSAALRGSAPTTPAAARHAASAESCNAPSACLGTAASQT